MNLITCCYKCPNRKVGCHATCSDYAEGVAENAKRNAGLFESILKSIETDVQRNEANNT